MPFKDPEKYKEYQIEYFKKNKKILNEKRKIYYLEHRDEQLKYQKKIRDKNRAMLTPEYIENKKKQYSEKRSKITKELWKNNEYRNKVFNNQHYEKRTGKNNWKWIEDRSKLCRTSKQGDRRTSIYFDWRKQVWERDKYKCKINNDDCGGKIEAHHIYSWNDYKDLRFNINNGITLCHSHHPRKREEEKRLIPKFLELVSVSNIIN